MYTEGVGLVKQCKDSLDKVEKEQEALFEKEEKEGEKQEPLFAEEEPETPAVIENIKDALPVTCTMIIMAMAWVILFTVILSAISVIRKNGIFDNVTRIVCIIGICVPSF